MDVRPAILGWVLSVAWAVLPIPDLQAQTEQHRLRTLHAVDDTPVPEVVVRVNGGVRATTDADGRAWVSWPRGEWALIQLEHLGYEAITFGTDTMPAGEEDWAIRMFPKGYELGPVHVSKHAPEEVYRRTDLHAADLFINDSGLWVLAYERPRLLRAGHEAGQEILRDVRLVLLDDLLHERASCPVPEEVYGLRHDLRNDVLIEGARHAFGVGWKGDRLVLLPFSLDTLRRSVLPWTDSIPGWVLGSNAVAEYPALDHLALGADHDSLVRICTVVDSFMMELFRSEYKYLKGPDKVLAMHLADELGVDKETVAGLMSGFSRNIWYEPLFAPLFVVGDTLLVFDHARGRLRKFDRTFTEARGVVLPYAGGQRDRQWTGDLVQDRATQRIHALFQRNGRTWLRAIDPVSGRLGRPFHLTYRWPQRVQVHQDWVYYIWRPEGSLQKRTLYRERLGRWIGEE